MKESTIYNCTIFTLPKTHNRAGNITALNNSIDLPFDVRRVYYLYDIPGGEVRGGHAHKELQQLIVAVSGSFDVTLDDGHNKKTVTLNRPNFGLHVIPGIWRDLSNFSSGAVCLVLASHVYDENDYIRDYHQFKEGK
ncbi:MAG: FdtA/QdtA family cupin domain-containing protein [Candidatus Symbiothrix sp.]|jgi:dTDP-4-dehydrorhamnose 3,5-epimerase-like enzyme|nr:FdtA/QdtA family cupin domain-containing protein [Candidatus Symbiothrix sp.]